MCVSSTFLSSVHSNFPLLLLLWCFFVCSRSRCRNITDFTLKQVNCSLSKRAHIYLHIYKFISHFFPHRFSYSFAVLHAILNLHKILIMNKSAQFDVTHISLNSLFFIRCCYCCCCVYSFFLFVSFYFQHLLRWLITALTEITSH